MHTSIDGESRVILDNKVTTGSYHESQLYLKRLRYIENKYGVTIKEVIADRAYGAAGNIRSLYAQNIIPYIPLFSGNSGKIVQLESMGFNFDQEHNRYICSQGKLLSPTKTEGATIYKPKSSDCRDCTKNTECSASLRQYSPYIRHIYRSHSQSLYEAEQQRMKTKLFKIKLRERRWKIEGINAEAKNLHVLKRAKYRGLAKVQIQAYMTGIVQNLKRLIQVYIVIILSLFIFNIVQKSRI